MNPIQTLDPMPPRPPLRPRPPPLDLRHFLLRSEALHLYRAFLRVAARAPGGSGGSGNSSPRAELAATIRAEFERAKRESGGGESGGKGGAREGKEKVSTVAIKHAIADGKLQLKRLEEMLGMQR